MALFITIQASLLFGDDMDSMTEARQLAKLVEQLQRKRQGLGDSDRYDSVLTAQGYAGAPPMVRVNYGGIIANAMDAYKRSKLDNELEGATGQAEDAKRRMMQEAMADGEMTPEKMIQLSEAGVDPATLKLIAPQKTSKSVVYQTLASNPSLAPLFVAEGIIDQATADSVLNSYNAQRAQEKQDKLDIAVAGRSGGGGGGGGGLSGAQIANYGRTAAGMRALNKVQPGTFSDEEIAQAEANDVSKSSGNSKDTLTAEKDYQTALAAAQEAKSAFEGATQSGAGKLIDQGAAFFGQSTEGAQQAAKLKVIGAKLVGTVPRFSGPQSDKDVQLYKEAAGQVGDDSVPIATRKAALETVMNLFNAEEARRNSSKPATPVSDWGIEEVE